MANKGQGRSTELFSGNWGDDGNLVGKNPVDSFFCREESDVSISSLATSGGDVSRFGHVDRENSGFDNSRSARSVVPIQQVEDINSGVLRALSEVEPVSRSSARDFYNDLLNGVNFSSSMNRLEFREKWGNLKKYLGSLVDEELKQTVTSGLIPAAKFKQFNKLKKRKVEDIVRHHDFVSFMNSLLDSFSKWDDSKKIDYVRSDKFQPLVDMFPESFHSMHFVSKSYDLVVELHEHLDTAFNSGQFSSKGVEELRNAASVYKVFFNQVVRLAKAPEREINKLGLWLDVLIKVIENSGEYSESDRMSLIECYRWFNSLKADGYKYYKIAIGEAIEYTLRKCPRPNFSRKSSVLTLDDISKINLVREIVRDVYAGSGKIYKVNFGLLRDLYNDLVEILYRNSEGVLSMEEKNVIHKVCRILKVILTDTSGILSFDLSEEEMNLFKKMVLFRSKEANRDFENSMKTLSNSLFRVSNRATVKLDTSEVNKAVDAKNSERSEGAGFARVATSKTDMLLSRLSSLFDGPVRTLNDRNTFFQALHDLRERKMTQEFVSSLEEDKNRIIALQDLDLMVYDKKAVEELKEVFVSLKSPNFENIEAYLSSDVFRISLVLALKHPDYSEEYDLEAGYAKFLRFKKQLSQIVWHYSCAFSLLDAYDLGGNIIDKRFLDEYFSSITVMEKEYKEYFEKYNQEKSTAFDDFVLELRFLSILRTTVNLLRDVRLLNDFRIPRFFQQRIEKFLRKVWNMARIGNELRNIDYDHLEHLIGFIFELKTYGYLNFDDSFNFDTFRNVIQRFKKRGLDSF